MAPIHTIKSIMHLLRTETAALVPDVRLEDTFVPLLITVWSICEKQNYISSSITVIHHDNLFCMPNQLVIKSPSEKNS